MLIFFTIKHSILHLLQVSANKSQTMFLHHSSQILTLINIPKNHCEILEHYSDIGFH